MAKKGWTEEQKDWALAWLATSRTLGVYREVRISARNWRGWPADARTHVFDGVAVDDHAGRVMSWGERAFADSITRSVVRPVVAWSFADRPVLGVLVAGSAMLARSYPGHGPIQPIALVEAGKDDPNTTAAYHLRGIEIVAVPRDITDG